MMRVVLAGVSVAAALYLAACALLYFFQESMIYFPRAGEAGNEESLLVDGERILVVSRRLQVPEAVLYFGGNAEDVTYSQDSLIGSFPDHALYLIKYRGYGGSTGRPREAGLIRDALALYDLVAKRHPKVVVVGRSLGSGIAVQLASLRPVARLVLVTPFDSVAEVAAEIMPLFPVRWLIREKYESWRYAPRVSAPTLLIAAERDEVIPMARTRALLASFRPGVASLKVVARAGHNDISERPEYELLLRGGPEDER